MIPLPGPAPPPPAAAAPAEVLFLVWRDTTHPEGGGSERYVERVAAGLVARGLEATVFCAAHPGAPAEELVDGVRIVRRGTRWSVYPRAFLSWRAGRLGRPAVVVDVQNGLPFFARRWCRRPVIVLVHHVHREQWPMVFGRLLGRVGWWLESRLAPRANRGAHYVTVSEGTHRELEQLGVDPATISVVHNGAEAWPDPPGAARTPFPSLCVLGRLVPHKRVELALDAAARIRRRLPGLKVYVAGKGYWEPELRRHAEALGLGDAVEFLGWLDEAAKHELLARSWVLAMPSVKEGWGQVVMEAAGHGTPAVAFRSAGGLAESVLHERTGLLAADGEDFAAQLERLLADAGLRWWLGGAAREWAACFNWEKSVAAFADVLDRIVPAITPRAAGTRPLAASRRVGRGERAS